MRLSRKEFKAWLEANRRRVVYGPTGSMSLSCPVARYLAEDRGRPYSVGRVTYAPVREGGFEGKQGYLPPWATKFIDTIDGVHLDAPRRRITGARALRILEEVGQ